HPERGLRLVDIDDGDIDRRLVLHALRASLEPEIVLRGGRALVPRIQRMVGGGTRAARSLSPNGTVLVTGGTGELGQALAEHLVREHGVGHLVLGSRRGSQAPGARALVSKLEALGAKSVRVVACDRARYQDVARLVGS